MRLDVNAAGTGITDAAGNLLSGGFTTGQIFTRLLIGNGTWLRALSGGLWSDNANWQDGIVGSGAGNTAAFNTIELVDDNVVLLDAPQTIGNLVFGDSDPGSTGNWIVDDGGNPGNTLTLAAAGAPTLTVNALGADAAARLAAPLAGTAGLTKIGPGPLVLDRVNTLTGAINVNAGTLRLDPGSSLNTGTGTVNVGVTAGVRLQVNGGSLSAGGLVTIGSGTGGGNVGGLFTLDSGTATFGAGADQFRFGQHDSRQRRHVHRHRRQHPAQQRRERRTSTSGFIVNGGAATVGTIGLGTNNSNGALTVAGGSLVATGTVTIGNQATAARGGAMRVIGGTFTSTDTVNGVVLARTSGTNANNVASAAFTGGVSTVEKITLGFDATVTAGSATADRQRRHALPRRRRHRPERRRHVRQHAQLQRGDGRREEQLVHIPSDCASQRRQRRLQGGRCVRSAARHHAHRRPLRRRRADQGGPRHARAARREHVHRTGRRQRRRPPSGRESGVRGSGERQAVAFSPAPARSIAACSLTPAASSARAAHTPGSTLTAATLTWNGGGALAIDLASGNRLAVAGALNRGSGGALHVELAASAPLAVGTVVTLATFASTNAVPGDFTYGGLPDCRGVFIVGPTSLAFLVTGTGPTAAYTDWAYQAGLPRGSAGAGARSGQRRPRQPARVRPRPRSAPDQRVRDPRDHGRRRRRAIPRGHLRSTARSRRRDDRRADIRRSGIREPARREQVSSTADRRRPGAGRHPLGGAARRAAESVLPARGDAAHRAGGDHRHLVAGRRHEPAHGSRTLRPRRAADFRGSLRRRGRVEHRDQPGVLRGRWQCRQPARGRRQVLRRGRHRPARR